MKKRQAEKKNMIMNFVTKKVDKENFIISGIFSTADEDRHGDVVQQNWDLKNFNKNPVILNSHNYNDITEILGKVIRLSNEKIKGNEREPLNGDIQFAVNENPKAKIAFDLYANGYANCFSVGFIPKMFDDEGQILKSELLEISLVSVPANAMALAKGMGIEVEKLYEKTIEEGKEETTEDNVDADTENKDLLADNIDAPIVDPLPAEPTPIPADLPSDEIEKPLDEVAEKSIKKTASQLLNEVVRGEVDIRTRALNKVLNATKLLCEELKVVTHISLDDRINEKSVVNKAIRELLDLKKALK